MRTSLLSLPLLALLVSLSQPLGAAAGPPADDAGPQQHQIALTPVPEPGTGTADGAPDPGVTGPVLAARADLSTPVSVVGVTWRGEAPAEVRMRTLADREWTAWKELEVVGGEGRYGTEGDALVDAEAVQVQLTGAAEQASLTVWDVQERALDAVALPRADGVRVADGVTAAESTGNSADTASQTPAPRSSGPVIATRAQWGANESVRQFSPRYVEESRGVTIHHTAGTNAYTAAQVPAIVRGIYHYHAVTLGWGDIGYSVMVDKFGRAWEGRFGGIDSGLRTAHAFGMNHTTAGIAILGDYEAARVPTAGFEAMAAVTAWKLDAHGVKVTDRFTHVNDHEKWTRTLPAVHAHRDVNQTLCPGRHFTSRMGEFRTRVGVYQSRSTVATQRIGGQDRYATAALLAQQAKPHGTDTVYLTGGEAVADALSVGPLAARQDAAVLLTKPDVLPGVSAARLSALAPKRVVVVGGPTRVNDSVLARLRAGGVQVTRIAGTNRYQTAALLAGEYPAADVVYLASGEVLADALGGGAAAARAGAPLLLTGAAGLPAETREQLARLAPREVVILGGTLRVPTAIEDNLRALIGGVTLTRLAGGDRYSTSAAVAAHGWPRARGALLANGDASVDAVAGTQLAAHRGDPVVLVRRTCQPGAVRAALGTMGTRTHLLLGGTTALADSAATRTC